MNRLIAQTPEVEPRELALSPGKNLIGRAGMNNFIIQHSSVSSRHCEIIVEDAAVTLQDLQSTNGTYLNGQLLAPHQPVALSPGQTVRFGSVDYLYTNQEGVAGQPRLSLSQVEEETATANPTITEPVAFSENDAPCHNHPTVPARWICKRCENFFCDGCINLRHSGTKVFRYCPLCRGICVDATPHLESRKRAGQSFFKLLPEVPGYPFRKGGTTFLLAGTLFYLVMDFAARFSWIATIFAGGYLFAYMQKIVLSSAHGDEVLPGWPDFSDVWEDIGRPFFLMVWSFLVAFAPMIFYLMLRDRHEELNPFIFFATIAFGGVYFPMSLLAVFMFDNFASLNPLVVLPAIMAVPLEYFLACVAFFLAYGASGLSERILEKIIPIPLLPTVITGFASLYFMTLEMRILGLLYFTNRKRLGWFH
ncbi:MAG TPA: FHA domain-containing protein [Verrucomicrobiae bacterium]|nr:FHA domain-containing protein [Verrucomicrobiae bacterium]